MTDDDDVMELRKTHKAVKAVLFDLDGTLLDTESLSDKATIEAFGNSLPHLIREERRQDGDRLPWEIKKEILGKQGEDWVPMVISYAQKTWGVNSNIRANQLWNNWEMNLNSFCKDVKECEGATKLIKMLVEKGIPIAIATSSRTISVQKKRLRHEHIFQPMTTIVTGDDPLVKKGKPAPDIYLEAARRLGIKPEDCLVFEDSISGCQSGKAAGCAVIAVPDSRMEKLIFDEISDQVLDNLNEFDPAAWGL
mmetsp:Transcript_3026/g.3559  ORF Transcript_3026/g.3559 Transcript_3026/m.3559 type:complete len:251 (-) Transcript_3026:435-1187(-)